MRQPERGGQAKDAGEAFWRFSLALYARPGVAEALVELQDRAGRDVNLQLGSGGAPIKVRTSNGGVRVTKK